MRRARILVAVVATIIVGSAGALYATLAGRGFGSRGAKPGALEEFVALKARALATPREIRDLVNPLKPTPLAIAEARDHFADHCATCHGNDGAGHTMINNGLYPAAPDLRSKRTQELTDGEIFGIIRDGIRLSGMPGFGGGDQDNWKLALFVRHLPELSDEELAMMKEVNGGTQ